MYILHERLEFWQKKSHLFNPYCFCINTVVINEEATCWSGGICQQGIVSPSTAYLMQNTVCSSGLFCNLVRPLKKCCLFPISFLLARDCESVPCSSILSLLSQECETCKSQRKMTKCRKNSFQLFQGFVLCSTPFYSLILLALTSLSEIISYVSPLYVFLLSPYAWLYLSCSHSAELWSLLL